MSEPIIKVENISKLYRLGQVGTGTLSDDLKRWWHLLRGKEDPFLVLGQENKRASNDGVEDFVWSLKDINFEVKEGEVLGIVGKNGAGKSTLLKILSKITAPTTGEISIKGRVASLLEVGTGFHPELTGRENIFLNGTILGMTKQEVSSKLDEIVEFSGVAKYLDTPVKRYSSGMLVRLGFAVAAHLEPEILIVDEVLAVGDADFQKKCIGKMKDVSGEGRTVLFVSHNMAAVRSLCSKAIFLENGLVREYGEVNSIVDSYLSLGSDLMNHKIFKDPQEGVHAQVLEFGIRQVGMQYSDSILIEKEMELNMRIKVMDYNKKIDLAYHFKDDTGNIVFTINTLRKENFISKNGEMTINTIIPANLLNSGAFYVDALVLSDKRDVEVRLTDILSFQTTEEPLPMGFWMGKQPGALKPNLEWKVV